MTLALSDKLFLSKVKFPGMILDPEDKEVTLEMLKRLWSFCFLFEKKFLFERLDFPPVELLQMFRKCSSSFGWIES